MLSLSPRHEDTKRRRVSANQKRAFARNWVPGLILGFSASETMRDNVCSLKHTVYGILLEQSKLIKTQTFCPLKVKLDLLSWFLTIPGKGITWTARENVSQLMKSSSQGDGHRATIHTSGHLRNMDDMSILQQPQQWSRNCTSRNNIFFSKLMSHLIVLVLQSWSFQYLSMIDGNIIILQIHFKNCCYIRYTNELPNESICYFLVIHKFC